MLLLLDGSSMLSSCFFGTVPKAYHGAKTEQEIKKALKKIMQTKKGLYTNGVFAMTKTLLGIIEKQNISKVVVAWDVSRNTFRKELYPEYKANRSETRPELVEQYKLMQEILDSAGIAQYFVKGYEADDIIGTIANMYQEKMPICVMSKDMDLAQLIDDKVRFWQMTSKAPQILEELGGIEQGLLPGNVVEFTVSSFKKYHNISPNQVTDFKAIVGDVSDNIPGVKGVGEKTAIPLLREYESLEEIYEAIEDEEDFKNVTAELGIKNPINKLQKKKNKELAFLSKQLGTIEKNVPVEVNEEDFEVELNWEELNKKFEKLEFFSLIRQVQPEQPEETQQQILFS